MNRRDNYQDYPIHVLRENLRQASVKKASMLSRSVGLLTSYDAQPCTEYGTELDRQYSLAGDLLFVQRCRAALERSIASGYAKTTYKKPNGDPGEVRFRRTSPGRIRAYGLPDCAQDF